MSSMLKRLQQVEALNVSLRKEVQEKTEQVALLKDQNKQLSMAASPDSFEKIANLTMERDRYKQQVEEMTKFLSDYGLKWVGGEGGMREGAFDAQSVKDELKFAGPSYRSNLPSEIDTDVLQRRIEELNFIAEKQRIATMGNGMKGFKILDDVPIFFFQNGLMIKGFPFYPYYSKQAQVSTTFFLPSFHPYPVTY